MKRTVFSIAIVALTFLLFARASEDGQAQTAIDGAPNEHAVRATLYEEDPGNSAGNEFEGSVKWRVDKADLESDGPISTPRRDCDSRNAGFPLRSRSVSTSTRHSRLAISPKSRLLSLPTVRTGSATVRGILVKRIREHSRHAGSRASLIKSRPNVFAIAYPDDQVEETTELLYGRRWLEIAMVFVNGRRALLAIDKDVPGGRCFQTSVCIVGPAQSTDRSGGCTRRFQLATRGRPATQYLEASRPAIQELAALSGRQSVR